jgi:hypothetical protein
MAVTLYRQVGKGKDRRYQKVNLGRGRRPADLSGPYFLRYSLADGTHPWEHVGEISMKRSPPVNASSHTSMLDANVPVIQDQDDASRTKITDAVYQWSAELQLFHGKDQQGKSEKTLRAYNYRLGFFLDFTAQNNLRYVDQVDRKQLLRYVKFLRDHENDLEDRTVHNVFETLNTFLRTRDIFIAGKILAELDYAEKPPKPYTKQELKAMFAAMDEEREIPGANENSESPGRMYRVVLNCLHGAGKIDSRGVYAHVIHMVNEVIFDSVTLTSQGNTVAGAPLDGTVLQDVA